MTFKITPPAEQRRRAINFNAGLAQKAALYANAQSTGCPSCVSRARAGISVNRVPRVELMGGRAKFGLFYLVAKFRVRAFRLSARRNICPSVTAIRRRPRARKRTRTLCWNVFALRSDLSRLFSRARKLPGDALGVYEKILKPPVRLKNVIYGRNARELWG